MLAGDFDFAGVEGGGEDFFLVVGGLGEDAAEGIADEGPAPELEAGVGADFEVAGLADDFADGGWDPVEMFGDAAVGMLGAEEDVAELVADAVGGADEDAVRDGVGALDGLPGGVLAIAELGFFGGVPADGGGVEEDFGAAEGGFSGGFGVPLIPADEGADGAGAGVGGEIAEVAGGEVELFVEERVVGDVHLAVDGGDGVGGGGCRVHVSVWLSVWVSVWLSVEGDGGVVVEAGGAAFEEGGDEDDAVFAGYGGEGLGGRAGDGFGEVEEGVIFALAEVLGAEELGEADEVRAEVGGLLDAADGFAEVEVRVGGHGHLDEGDLDGFSFRGHGSGLDV